MAPMKNIFAALALASCALAVPLGVDRRAAVTNTVTVTEWTTIDTTTTVWVDEPSPSPKVESAPAAAAAITTPAAAAAPSPSPAAPAAQPVVAQANAPAAYPEQPQSSPPAAATSAPPVAQAPPPGSIPSVQPKTAGASSGPCEGQGSSCTGDVTFYEGGLGACGWNVNTASDMQIALPHGMMGTQSNGNPYCGRSLTIKSPGGATISATVGDKCMGCEGNSIDLTDALFKAVVPNGDGRVAGIEWWFD